VNRAITAQSVFQPCSARKLAVVSETLGRLELAIHKNLRARNSPFLSIAKRAVGTLLISLRPTLVRCVPGRRKMRCASESSKSQIPENGDGPLTIRLMMRADSNALTTFFRDQGIYLILALVVGAIFWAIGQPINFFTVLLYSLCIGNFLSPPMQWLHVLYEKPAPYDWIIFLILLCVVTLPVYGLSTVIVWCLAPPTPQSLGHLITTGWKMPFLITIVYGLMNFLYGRTRARLERRNFELQGMVQAGAARLEIQEEELQRAREIQESLLPKEIPQLPGFEVASAWQPARGRRRLL
jgi:hypothetical protein